LLEVQLKEEDSIGEYKKDEFNQLFEYMRYFKVCLIALH